MVLAFTGWMDGGDVSTGTVRRLVDLLGTQPIAEIEPEPFYIYHFPGSMELTAFSSSRQGRGGSDQVHRHGHQHLLLPRGRQPGSVPGQGPALRWPTFGACIFDLAYQVRARRILFVGSFGGSVPHTREPRLFVTCSTDALLPEMERYGFRRSVYEGPGSFTTFLQAQAAGAGLEMTSLVAEIPGYLQGTNPLCIEAVTRRLAKILRLPLDLASLRAASTQWELGVSRAIEENDELAQRVRQLEEAYDSDLLRQEDD